MLYKSTKVSTGVGVGGSAASNLYDFGSIKSQVQNKSKGAFFKRNPSSKKDPLIPVYTTQQIINSVNIPPSLSSQKSINQKSMQ